MDQLNILLIDKDQSTLTKYQQLLQVYGYSNMKVIKYNTDADVLSASQPDVVFLGNKLGYEMGMQLLKLFRSIYPGTDVILLPGFQYQHDMQISHYRINDVSVKTDHILDYIISLLDRLTVIKRFNKLSI